MNSGGNNNASQKENQHLTTRAACKRGGVKGGGRHQGTNIGHPGAFEEPGWSLWLPLPSRDRWWAWGDDRSSLPGAGTCSLGTCTAAPGLSGTETDEIVCILGPWATQESHLLCKHETGEKKKERLWGLWRVCQGSECLVQLWLELNVLSFFCIIYKTFHDLVTTLHSLYLSHSPKTSRTSTDHQKTTKTPKFHSLAFKAKNSLDTLRISCLHSFAHTAFSAFSTPDLQQLKSFFFWAKLRCCLS